jgi:hypothetical protein
VGSRMPWVRRKPGLGRVGYGQAISMRANKKGRPVWAALHTALVVIA